jgi:hypothetical protein
MAWGDFLDNLGNVFKPKSIGISSAAALSLFQNADAINTMIIDKNDINENTDFYKENFAPIKEIVLDGSAYISLNESYVLENDGDYLEFEAAFNNISGGFLQNLGLFGVASTTNNTIGFNNQSLFSIRGESTNWMNFSVADVFHSKMNVFKILINGTNIELYINDLFIGSTIFLSPITISSIGNTYGSKMVEASLSRFTIFTSTKTMVSTNITDDNRFTFVNTQEKLTPRSLSFSIQENDLKIKYNGTDKLIILKPQANSGFIGYSFKRSDTKIKSDNWRINQAFESSSDFTLGTAITNDGEWETAIKIKDASDFMGGQAHGNETLTYFMALVDGKEIDLTSSFEVSCNTFEFIQISNLTVPAVREANDGEIIENYPTEGTIAAVSTKRWVFNSKVENKLYQKIKWNIALTLVDTYLFMLPIYRLSLGNQITHSFLVSDNYEKVDVSLPAHSNPYYVGSLFGGNARIWGDIYSAKVDILKGWKNASHFNVSPSTTYNKVYFDFTGDYETNINEVMEAEIAFDVIKGIN